MDTCGVIITSITEPSLSNQSLSVFPNPATTIATFHMNGFDGNKTLIIYDQFGKEIWRKETSENQIEFSTSGFASGLYFYKVHQNENISSTGRFIIQ